MIVMKKKIFRSYIILSAITILLSIVSLIFILYNKLSSQLVVSLKNDAIYLENIIENNQIDSLKQLNNIEDRITIIKIDGTVLFDNQAHITDMENHLEREEIKQAIEKGEGQSHRYSSTLSVKTIYYAKLLPNGIILRVSRNLQSVWSILLNILRPIIILFIVIIAFSIILSNDISKKIVSPINKIDLNNPENNNTYEELSPLLIKIAKQNERVKEQMEALSRKQYEFELLTENMSEGFILVDKKYEVLSYNKSAEKLFGISKNNENNNILAINRSQEFRKSVDDSFNGKHNSQKIELNNKFYQIVSNPVYHNTEVIGVVLIILDITEKEERELLRQEFTSNVSHELKTPLTSIYGISDMISNGLVKQEDIAGFINNIKEETTRMITLIDDIIKLSKLDEGGKNIERADVDLYEIANNVMIRFQNKAKSNKVNLSLEGKNVIINGSKSILEEMVANLIDNAIKYNHPNGYVKILVDEIDNPFLSVTDTGIGIPDDCKERVFERFFRVEKSRSKTVEGTGLGLSIVKHGAIFHNAKVYLESKVNVGTMVKIVFKKG